MAKVQIVQDVYKVELRDMLARDGIAKEVIRGEVIRGCELYKPLKESQWELKPAYAYALKLYKSSNL